MPFRELPFFIVGSWGRRLKALHDMKSGLAKAITGLSDATQGSRDAAEAIAEQVREAMHALNDTLESVAHKKQEAEDILETLDGQVHQAKRRVTQSMKQSKELADQLFALTERSRVELGALRQGVEIANKVNALTREQVVRRVRRHARSDATATVHALKNDDAKPAQKPDPMVNPFKHAIGGN